LKINPIAKKAAKGSGYISIFLKLFNNVRIASILTACLIAIPVFLNAQMTMSFDNDLSAYNRGLELLGKQKYGAAKEQFEQAIKTVDNPNSEISANAHFYVAQCAIELFHKDSEYLLKEFVRNYSTSPRVSDAWFLLGNYNYRKRDYEDAIAFYGELDANDLEEPKRSEYLFKKGYSHFQEDQKSAAADLFYQMKDQTSVYFAPGVYYLGHVNYQTGKHASALKQFQSLEGHPQFGEVVPYYIVQIYHFQEQFDELIGYGTPLLENNDIKRRDEISRLIGEALYSQKEYAEAAPFLERYMLSPYGKKPEDYYALGYAYYKSNQFEKAAETFSKISYNDDLLGQNSLYHLGESYLRSNKKSYARNAYRAASKMSFDEKLQEDALFKYALLSFELSYDPYDGAISAFKEYIRLYPNTDRTQQSFDYLVHIYLTSRNYDMALSSIDEYENPDIRLRDAYQRIAFNKGVSLFQERLFADAITYFDKSLKYDQGATITAQALYWKAESFYNRGDYANAVKTYEKFIYSPGAVLTPYFNLANYNIGYAFFQQERFKEAPSWFRRYTAYRAEKDATKLADANLRIGDSYFMVNDYQAADDYYNNAITAGKASRDYALFQSGLTAGLLKNYPRKILKMNKLIAEFSSSSYVSAAYYELGKTYLLPEVENQAKSIELFQKVIDEFPGSSYVRKAMVSIGQTFYNQSKNDEALSIYLRVVKEFPTYEDTREALQGIENIYSERGQIDEYEKLLAGLDYVNISDVALDTINYQAAEKQYFNAQCAAAVQSFDRYLTRFEKAIFELNARSYRAECLMKMGQEDRALIDFEYVAQQPKSKFSENSLLYAARINFKRKNYPNAQAFYQRLSLLAERRSNLNEAAVGLMRCNFYLNNFQGAISNALAVIDEENVDNKLKNEASLLIAKSNLEMDDPSEANFFLKQVVAYGSPSQAAEASYLQARIEFRKDNLDSAEALVFNLVEKHQAQSFWLGKSLVLLSDIYITRGDLFQAKATLQNIIDNYLEDDQVKHSAIDKLARIEEIEAEPEEVEEPEIEIDFEESVSPENQVAPQDTLRNE
jgi:TolA-binding protein